MKILDRYIAKNFIIGYVISFCVLIGLRIIMDLFVNLDEFTEQHVNMTTWDVVKNILIFYGLNSTLYFRDFAAMITVIAAAFSFGKMVRQQELVAIMASGVSLKRVISPVIFLAILLTGLLVIDQEMIIPLLSDKLVRSHDDIPGEEKFSVEFMSDAKGSKIYSQQYDVKTATLHRPLIIPRRPTDTPGVWETVGRIDAESATYNYEEKRWDLLGGVMTLKDIGGGRKPIPYYVSDLTPKDIPVRRKSENKTLLSSRQLAILASHAQKNKQIKDLAQLYSQKHFRIADPIINIVMLMVCLPLLVCRDPKAMKSATVMSFGLTGMCMVVNFVCKLFASEIVFGQIRPEIWAWLPIFIFLPIALVEIDSMKT
jgi:lipopolysaccharide export system permease protein